MGIEKRVLNALISIAKARKCLMKGCKASMEYVVDSIKEKVSKENIDVVKVFAEVFPQELLG